MNWFYESGGSQQGPVSEAELDRLLAEGKISVETLVWREGLAGWSPLRTVRPAAPAAPDLDLEVTRPGTPAAQAPIGHSPMAPMSPIAPVTPVTPVTPAGTSATSPGLGSDLPQPGWIRCTYTGRYFPPSDIVYIEGKPYSAAAKPQVLASLASGSLLPDVHSDRNGPPWEHRAQLGIVKAALDTIKAVLLEPANTFSRMKRAGGLWEPLLFYMIAGTIGGIVTAIVQTSLNVLPMAFGSSSSSGQSTALIGGIFVGGMLMYLITIPIWLAVAAFIGAGILHLCLMLLGCARQPFETTFRVYVYAHGAGAALQVVPVLGAIVGGVWGIVCACIGTARAHEITTGKATMAVLLPVFVCCGLMIVGVIIAVAFGAMSR